jgi:hypothetical protein
MKAKEKIDAVLEKSSDAATSFTDRFTQSWRAYAAGAAFLLSVSLVLLWVALYRPFAKSAEAPQIVLEPAASTSTAYERALDGVIMEDASSTHLLPLAVMVENSTDALPLSGPARANLVIEAPVEGSITRFMLVFDPSNEVVDIGPVRSARHYYVDWADGLDAMYAHVGGSPDALSEITRLDGFRDLNQFFNDRFFSRSSRRSAPHNVFTSTEKLVSAMEDKEFEAGDFRPWLYEDPTPDPRQPTTDDTQEGQGDASQNSEETGEEEIEVSHITVPYQGAYRASWDYDEETGMYTRFQNGEVQKDADGEIVRAKNVVVIQTYATVVDREGRLSMRTTGRGEALIFHDGKKYEGEWKRLAGEHIRFETVDGRDIPFARGNTWISVLTSYNAMYRVLND